MPLAKDVLSSKPIVLVPARRLAFISVKLSREGSDFFVSRFFRSQASSCGDFSASARTSVTNLRTRSHLLVVGKAFTISCAPLTYFGTSGTSRSVEVGTAQHECNARITDIDAIEQQANVRWLHVTATLFDAVAKSLDANVMALTATGDAVLKIYRLHIRSSFPIDDLSSAFGA